MLASNLQLFFLSLPSSWEVLGHVSLGCLLPEDLQGCALSLGASWPLLCGPYTEAWTELPSSSSLPPLDLTSVLALIPSSPPGPQPAPTIPVHASTSAVGPAPSICDLGSPPLLPPTWSPPLAPPMGTHICACAYVSTPSKSPALAGLRSQPLPPSTS